MSFVAAKSHKIKFLVFFATLVESFFCDLTEHKIL